MATAPPDPVFLEDAPEIAVARPTLGMTLYLAEPVAWANGGAAAMFEAFAKAAPVDRLRWYTTSQIPDWQGISGERLDDIHAALLHWLGKPRHLLRAKVVDDTGAPSVGFV